MTKQNIVDTTHVDSTDSEELERLRHQAAEAEAAPVTKAEKAAEADEAAATLAAAEASAAGLMTVICGTVEVVAGIDVDHKEAQRVAQKIAPALHKHGLHIGGAYAVELTAIGAFGWFVFGLYGQIKAKAAADAAAQKAQAEGMKEAA